MSRLNHNVAPLQVAATPTVDGAGNYNFPVCLRAVDVNEPGELHFKSPNGQTGVLVFYAADDADTSLANTSQFPHRVEVMISDILYAGSTTTVPIESLVPYV